MRVWTHDAAAAMLARPNTRVRAWILGLLVIVWDSRYSRTSINSSTEEA